jgi:alpha-amylase
MNLGFRAVQISPPMEHIVGSQWWTRYQPVTYNLTSRSGTEAELQNMITRCSNVGVGVIVDAVFNQMAADSGTGVAGSTFGCVFYILLITFATDRACSIVCV